MAEEISYKDDGLAILYPVPKKGINNEAADALSRKLPASSQLFAVATIQPIWLSGVIDSYAVDDQAKNLLQKLTLDPSAVSSFSLSQGIIRYKGCVWVGADETLRRQLISAFLAVAELHQNDRGGQERLTKI